MPDPLEIQFSCKAIFQVVWGEIGTPKPLLMQVQSFWVRKYPCKPIPYYFHSNFKFFGSNFGLRPRPSRAGPARAQAQPGPGRARICPAGIFPTSAFSRRSGIARGGAVEVGNLPQEVENRRFGERVGQIQAGQGFSRPPLILRGRANPCPA